MALAIVLVAVSALLGRNQDAGAASAVSGATQPPTIAGLPQEGNLLTAIPGRWVGRDPIFYSYFWRRCDRDGDGCTAIVGATQATYLLTERDVGGTVRVTVTGHSIDVRSSSVSVETAVVVQAGGPGISTLSVRRRWLVAAVEEFADRPLLGHGVGMFEDNTPEARLMGVSGQRTYPHNTFVESAHALGLLGLLTYAVFVGAAASALISAGRRRGLRSHRAFPFIVGVATFAFVNTNISGEIGGDALLWAAAALAFVVYTEAHA